MAVSPFKVGPPDEGPDHSTRQSEQPTVVGAGPLEYGLLSGHGHPVDAQARRIGAVAEFQIGRRREIAEHVG